MKRDFTVRVYDELLRALVAAGYRLVPFRTYVAGPDRFERVAVLRHDVDQMPRNALATARVEEALDVRASYYFRIVPESFDAAIMARLSTNGHEVGYHYEDLTLAGGDFDRAARLFADHLARFREVCPVDTICMHGSPLSRWDNRRLFERVDYRDYGIVAEPYFDLDFDRIRYLTDTGRRWDGEKVGVRDKVATRFAEAYATTFDIAEAARRGELPPHVMLNTHPQRWNDGYLLWGREFVMQNLKNQIKRLVVLARA